MTDIVNYAFCVYCGGDVEPIELAGENTINVRCVKCGAANMVEVAKPPVVQAKAEIAPDDNTLVETAPPALPEKEPDRGAGFRHERLGEAIVANLPDGELHSVRGNIIVRQDDSEYLPWLFFWNDAECGPRPSDETLAAWVAALDADENLPA